jgi:YD repeat-containing protein
MIFDDGMEYVFDSHHKVARITNKYDQSLSFAYSNSGALTTVTDTLGRTITYNYDDTDHLTSVAESGGKSVLLSYYGSGDTDGGLHDLRGIDIKNGNETKTIRFTYFTNTGDSNLDHNLSKLIDSNEQIYVENIYDANDRVLSQKYGDHIGSYNYTIADIHEDDTLTSV